MKNFAFTLDLEADYSGCVGEYGLFKEPEKIEGLLSWLSSFGVRITVFVVGEIFELYPEIVRIFEKYHCEFEAHSYSHSTSSQDLASEIEKSRVAYFSYFKKYPLGYRAPQGRITPSAIRLLEKHGFLYDSSVFPSYYPDPLRYLFCKRSVHYYDYANIMEIPMTSVSPFRLTLSVSYLKLLGFNFFLMLLRVFGLPDSICFNAHLHDFIVCEDSYSKLSGFWKFIYGRNKYSGKDYTQSFLELIQKRQYSFCFLSEMLELYKR
ncbi:MAG: polysaccharide deacetylase family protein [Candidatus Omnitrophica bacterium]|nr:polysaccharide deacetylase family protein [Candidatus Omnitrophota bacterium]